MPTVQVNGPVDFLQSGSYSAQDVRKSMSNNQVGPGVISYDSFRVSLASSLTLNINPGIAYVRQPADGTLYRVTQDNSAAQLTLAAGGANPRVDQIILRIYDAAVTSGSGFTATIETIDGTATSGATLDNRSGAPDPQTALINDKAYIPLADVLVPAGASSISGSNIRNRRPVGAIGMVPPLGVAGTGSVDMVQFEPSPGLVTQRAQILGSDHAGRQSAALMWLPRRIPATRIRWRYWQDNTTAIASSNNWNLAVVDASGRLISAVGSTAFAGTAGTAQEVVATLPAPYSGYYYEVGEYYIWYGISSGVGASQACYTPAVVAGQQAGTNATVPVSVNQFLAANPGNITFPATQTILGFLDAGTTGSGNPNIPVPIPVLSVG